MSDIDWTDPESAAEAMAGNWRKFDSFGWSRGYDLEDADKWAICYTSNRDSGLLAQSNEKGINDALQQFTEGDDPDVVLERHSHWAVGHVDGFSIRVYRPDGSITAAFEAFRKLKERLDNYPILDEQDYSEREYAAALENYRSEMWAVRDTLPEGWESEVYQWFSHNGYERCIENRDDQGAWAWKDKIIEALTDLGLMELEADEPIIANAS